MDYSKKQNWFEKHRATFSKLDIIEDKISDFCGTRYFFLIHVAWFAFWIVKPVEPFPYGLLTMIVSLEAILLSTILMMTSRRHSERDAAKAEHDYQVNEEALAHLRALAKKLDVEVE